MLWEYRDPEKKTFVSDGKTFYFYVPADRQVVVRDQAGARGSPLQLLSGQMDILRRSSRSALETRRPGRERLRLVPAQARPRGRAASTSTWTPSGRIRGIEILDAQGNRSRFEFEDMRENVGLPDALFRFEVPRASRSITG